MRRRWLQAQVVPPAPAPGGVAGVTGLRFDEHPGSSGAEQKGLLSAEWGLASL